MREVDEGGREVGGRWVREEGDEVGEEESPPTPANARQPLPPSTRTNSCTTSSLKLCSRAVPLKRWMEGRWAVRRGCASSQH